MNSLLVMPIRQRIVAGDMDIATRLDEAMRAAGFDSQSALSRASGVPQPTIARILKGTGKSGPETDTLAKLAQACNVSFRWLHEGAGAMSRTAEIPGALLVGTLDDNDPDVIDVPLVKLKLSAGIQGFAAQPEQGVLRKIRLDRSWLEKNGYEPSRLIAVTVKGESMEPALYDGDIVVINTADRRPVDGAVFAVNYEGEPVIKRLARDIGRWWLMSDNSDQRKYHRKSCEGDECIVVGRVVHLHRDGNRI